MVVVVVVFFFFFVSVCSFVVVVVVVVVVVLLLLLLLLLLCGRDLRHVGRLLVWFVTRYPTRQDTVTDSVWVCSVPCI